MSDKFKSEDTSTVNMQDISGPAIDIADSPTEHSDNIADDANEARSAVMKQLRKQLEPVDITIDSIDAETVPNNQATLQGKYNIKKYFTFLCKK